MAPAFVHGKWEGDRRGGEGRERQRRSEFHGLGKTVIRRPARAENCCTVALFDSNDRDVTTPNYCPFQCEIITRNCSLTIFSNDDDDAAFTFPRVLLLLRLGRRNFHRQPETDVPGCQIFSTKLLTHVENFFRPEIAIFSKF